MIRDLDETFAKFLEGLDEATLASMVTFPPPVQPSSKSRFEMLLSAKEHEMHHRGQLMTYQRLLGQVPHLTKLMQQRAAAMQAAWRQLVRAAEANAQAIELGESRDGVPVARPRWWKRVLGR